MFREVETVKDQEKFRDKWGKIAKKYQYSNKPPHGNETRYVIERELDVSELQSLPKSELEAEIIGAIEFVPFNPNEYSIVESYFPFSTHPLVVGKEAETFEIGKLCIDEEYQASGYFKDIFCIINEHHMRTGATQYVAMMRLYLFQMLTEKFGLEIHGLAKPEKHPIDYSLPVYFEVETLKQNKLVQRILRRHALIAQ